MRIPSGDLAPARRRRYGGGYGRRRKRNLRLVVLGLLLIGAGVGAAYLLQQEDSREPSRLTTQPSACPTPSTVATAPAALPLPRQVRLALLNGTPRNGLARTIAGQLVARGFVVTGQGNATSALAGPSQVAFGPGAEQAAVLVSHWVPGSTTVANPRVARGTVQVTLGSGFTRLATPPEAAAAATPTATPAPSPGCAA